MNTADTRKTGCCLSLTPPRPAPAPFACPVLFRVRIVRAGAALVRGIAGGRSPHLARPRRPRGGRRRVRVRVRVRGITCRGRGRVRALVRRRLQLGAVAVRGHQRLRAGTVVSWRAAPRASCTHSPSSWHPHRRGSWVTSAAAAAVTVTVTVTACSNSSSTCCGGGCLRTPS